MRGSMELALLLYRPFPSDTPFPVSSGNSQAVYKRLHNLSCSQPLCHTTHQLYCEVMEVGRWPGSEASTATSWSNLYFCRLWGRRSVLVIRWESFLDCSSEWSMILVSTVQFVSFLSFTSSKKLYGGVNWNTIRRSRINSRPPRS